MASAPTPSSSKERTDSGWNHRETDLAPAARGFGLIGMIVPSVVWGYAGVLALRGASPNHGMRYVLQVMSAASALFALPSLLAVTLGLAGVFRRDVGRAWRRKAAVGLALGLAGI